MMQTMQQKRAKFALEGVQNAKDRRVSAKEYKSYAAGFPAMIQMNGLGQAAAFYRSKGVGNTPKQVAYLSLYNLLSDWLKTTGQPYVNQDLLIGITTGNMHAYMLAQGEALALLDWVKKFAKAFMEETQTQSDDTVLKELS